MFRLNYTKRCNQLAIELLKKILNGDYKTGEKLTSTKELAKQFEKHQYYCRLNCYFIRGR